MKTSMAEADTIGVSATPTVFVNGGRLGGAGDRDEVRAALNQRLLEAGIQPPPPPAIPQPAPASKSGQCERVLGTFSIFSPNSSLPCLGETFQRSLAGGAGIESNM